MIAMKFGGTSVGSAEAIKRVAKIIESRFERQPVVITSAVGGITDKLVALGKSAATGDDDLVKELVDFITNRHLEIIDQLRLTSGELRRIIDDTIDDIKNLCRVISSQKNISKMLNDELSSKGEFLAAHILVEYLSQIKIPATFVDVREVLLTDSSFGSAKPLFDDSAKNAVEKILPIVKDGSVPVLQGFVGRDASARTTTLGRGGSDYSATLLGAMLGVDSVEIWSDVDGVLTADPSIVSEAKRIRSMTFKEAAELAYFGAKVLHPATLLPAVTRDIPVWVFNSMRPEYSGTKISRANNNGQKGSCIVKSIAYKENLTVITVTSLRMLMAHGFMASIFDIFNKYDTSVDLVSTSEVSVSMTVDKTEHIDEIKEELSRFAQVEIEQDKAIVCLVGEQMKRTPGMPASIFCLLQDVPIHLISQGASEINISFVIDDDNVDKVITRLHQHFFSGALDPNTFAV